MRMRTIDIFLAGIVAGALLLTLATTITTDLPPTADARQSDTWQIAGGPDGFPLDDWGQGLGPERSLDEWIQQLPASCDIEILDRGLSGDTILYRCPTG